MAERDVVGWAAGQNAVELEFHGVLYTINIQTHEEDALLVEIEDKDTFDRWRGEFAAKYVEDITRKTGSFKKFAVFVRMLQSAVLQQSDSVYIDLLTYQDLELLKLKKAAASSSSSDTATQTRQLPANNKRYLILTYASEFDRVHYPLPLLHDGQPDPQRLKAVIQQLRQQLQDVTAGQQQQVALLQQQSGRCSKGSAAGCEVDAAVLASRLEVMAAQLECERAEHKRELRRSARQLRELQDELCRSHDNARQLRLKLKACEQELQAAKDRQQQRSATVAAAAAAGPYGRRTGGNCSNHHEMAGWSRGSSSSYLAAGSSKPRQYSKYPAAPGARNGSSSRPGSTGGSASSSRVQSPGYTRPWVHNSPPRPPRPSSAPPKQRFDPTQYVREKQQRQQQLAAQRSSSRGSSPARSRAPSCTGGGSGASTPRALTCAGGGSSSISRQNSAERCRGAAAGGVPPERGYLRPQALSSGSAPAGREHDDGSMRRSSSRERLGAVYGVSSAGGRGGNNTGRLRGSQQERRHSPPASRDGAAAASPGRALQGVRDKLSAFMAKQQQEQQQQIQHVGPAVSTASAAQQQQPSTADAAAAHSAGQLAAQGSRVFEDASSEIASIDQRLHALQDFLKKAKSSVAAR